MDSKQNNKYMCLSMSEKTNGMSEKLNKTNFFVNINTLLCASTILVSQKNADKLSNTSFTFWKLYWRCSPLSRIPLPDFVLATRVRKPYSTHKTYFNSNMSDMCNYCTEAWHSSVVPLFVLASSHLKKLHWIGSISFFNALARRVEDIWAKRKIAKILHALCLDQAGYT